MRNVDFAHSCTGCRAHRLHPGVSRRSCIRFLLEPVQVQLGSLRYSNETSAVKDDGYLEPKDLDETVSELHFSALGPELTVPTQVTQPSRSKTLPRVSTTVTEMQGPAESVVHSGRRSQSLRVFALHCYGVRVFVVECGPFCTRPSGLEESFQAAAIESIATEMDISVSSHR